MTKEEIWRKHFKDESVSITDGILLAMQEYAELKCHELLSDISKTFLNEDNLSKSFSYSDRTVFEAIGQTIQNFPLPKI